MEMEKFAHIYVRWYPVPLTICQASRLEKGVYVYEEKGSSQPCEEAEVFAR